MHMYMYMYIIMLSIAIRFITVRSPFLSDQPFMRVLYQPFRGLSRANFVFWLYLNVSANYLPITSTPMYLRSTSGTVTLPSLF